MRPRAHRAQQIDLPPRGSVRHKVQEAVALFTVGPEVRALMRDLERRGWELDHGTLQARFVYLGHGVGGINRGAGHGYVSKVLGRGGFGNRLQTLGFSFEQMPSPGEAFREHRWYQIDLGRGLTKFTQALREAEELIDSAKAHV